MLISKAISRLPSMHFRICAFLRFFACEEDLSHESLDAPLPAAVASGAEPFLIIGAIAGGS